MQKQALASNIDTDFEFQSTRITSVTDEGDSGWSVTTEEGWSLWVKNDQCSVRPAVGETLRTYGKGLGYVVRGIVINARVYRYQTKQEQRAAALVEAEKIKRDRATEYESKRLEFESKVAALPRPLRARIERFRALGGDSWRYEFEPYELFCCEQAAMIADAIATLRTKHAPCLFDVSSIG